jgi:DNA-binding winged helix-turn-helix (wHTH) protein
LPRFRFADFVLSPRRRVLLRGGVEQPLIPRYFDLLVFLVEHRHEAVHRQLIFDRVWNDVIVSDSALSQAVRTLRRTLQDNSREPIFIKTVARHGYQFVFTKVTEEPDEGALAEVASSSRTSPVEAVEPVEAVGRAEPIDDFEPLLQRLTRPVVGAIEEEERREAAELLLARSASEALRRLGTRPGHERARAVLRDARWDVAGAEEVPVLGQPAPLAVSAAILQLRLRRAARFVAARWAGAAIGGGIAGFAAGAIGGLMLASAPGSEATPALIAVLGALGTVAGAGGGAGVGAGLALAEAVARSQRTLAIVAGGALGGGLVGCATQYLARWSLASLVGVHVAVGGCVQGLVLGAGAGLGYALATHPPGGGLAAPRGARRLRAAGLTALACGIAALALALQGYSLVGGTIHAIALAASGSQAILTPLSRLIGEPDFGPLTRALLGTGEGAVFGFGLAMGLTRRPA